MLQYGEARAAYQKFIKSEKNFLGLTFSRESSMDSELIKFSDIQKENGAYSSSYIGIKNIEIDKIKGSVQKYMDFNKNFVPKNEVLEERWCRIYKAFVQGASLPPVVLYKIKDSYFVYDGNHRISVANFLDFKTIEAEVIEFLPSSDSKENVIYRQRFNFEKNTGLDNIALTGVNQYKRLLKEIKDFGTYLEEKEEQDLILTEVAEEWQINIYVPIIEILEKNKILDNFEGRTISDLFIYFLDHKYFISEKKKHDIGFTYSIIDFVNFIKTYNQNTLENIFVIDEENIENLKKLKQFDTRKSLDKDMLKKSDLLKKVTGLKLEHDFLMLAEIDEYIRKNKFESFEKGLEYWYANLFKKRLETFRKSISYLPEKYIYIAENIMEKRETLFYAIENYSILYTKRVQREINCPEVVANYILEIFIPIASIIIEQKINEIGSKYFGIQDRYMYLVDYKKLATMKEASDLYFSSGDKIYHKVNSWFLLKIGNNLSTNKAIEDMITNFEKTLDEKTSFRNTVEKYGSIGKYTTIINLEKAKKIYEELTNDSQWLKNKFVVDIEKLLQQEEIMIYYKTEKVMEALGNRGSKFSVVDFYADILAFSNHLGKDMHFVDIIDLAFEYKNR
jgi:hypothetical protein